MNDFSPLPESDGTAVRVLREEITGLRTQLGELQTYREQQDRGIALYHLITENIGDLIAVVGTDGRRIWNNKAYLETLGYTQEELSESVSFEQIHPEDRPFVEETFRESLATGKGRKIEYRMRHKDGHWIPLESRATVVHDDSGRPDCIVLMARDISDRKRMEEEIKQAQKVESVASISGKVADSFSELVTSMLGKLTMARQLVRTGTPEAKLLAEAAEVGERAQSLIIDLLSMSTQNVKATSTFHLQKVVRESVERAVPSGSVARTELFLADEPIHVQGSPQVIGGAFDHILHNAVESMDKRGLIRVDLGVERIERGGALLKAGLYAVLRIRDQGCGIREEHLRHVLEPYFSTKPGHQGIGLSSALAATSEHGGTVRVYSNFGTGTEVVVYLPAQVGEEPARRSSGLIPRGRERRKVLVMDDEKFVRDFVVALLDQLGYEAVGTKDGDELTEEFRASCRIRKPYQVVITDLLVPEGTGGESIPQRLRKMDPGVKIVVTSGFPAHPVLQRYREHGFDGALAKPFRADALREMLEALVGGPKV